MDAGSWSSRPVTSPPSYLGTVNDAAGCTRTYATVGFEPVDDPGNTHPLFLYFVGTTFVPGDTSSRYDCQAAQKVTEAMARRGFVALSVDYDNGPVAWLSDHVNQLDCLFGAGAESLLAAACGLPGVDCDLGIATWGHSQGALIADLAANYDARVRAAWATGYGGDSRATLARNRFRVVNGEADTTNGTVPSIDSTAGFTLAECPDDGRKECLRSDGSGWIIVQKKDCLVSSADHCWFDKRSCADGPETLEPNWIDPSSTKAFALEANADWVAATVRRR
jgi:acetyl esterase/lipase